MTRIRTAHVFAIGRTAILATMTFTITCNLEIVEPERPITELP
jgi:hypothetical protein